MAETEWWRDEFVISTDHTRLDRGLIWEFVSNAYWGKHLTREMFDRSVDNAIVFGLYAAGDGYSAGDRQIGFARVVSDFARMAWLSDVFVLKDHRGLSLGHWLVDTVMGYPPFDGVDRWFLGTADAHEFYRPYGFTEFQDPKRYMLRRADPSVP
ncbi:MAG: GNAT family N-acetyltransferase [Rhodospirillales bacterium]|nr:GNAT family N-acetyltransferase [Rhodospirillales bacterium]